MPCTHVHTEDLRGSLTTADAGAERRRPADRRAGAGRGAARPSCSRRRTTAPGVRYRDAMAVLDAALPDGVDIVVDAGNIGASAIHYLPVRRDGRFIVALGMGGMGYSFGAGVGMAFGRQSGGTVVIAGDGSFFMHGMEIHTALQYRPAGDVPAVRQPRARDVRDPRAAVLRRPLQLQPVRRRAGSAPAWPPCSPAWRRSTSTTIDDLPAALQAALDIDGPVGRQRRVLGRRNPAIRKLSRQGRREESRYHRGEQFPCRCPRLMTSPPTEAQPNRSTGLSASRRRRGRRPRRSSWR